MICYVLKSMRFGRYPMSNKQGKEIPWWAIVLGFMIFPPIGFILLFLSLGEIGRASCRERVWYRV